MVLFPEAAPGQSMTRGIDAGADGIKNRLAGAGGGQINGAATVEIQFDPGFVRGDEGANHLVHIATRKKVRFQLGGGHFNPCADGGDAGVDDERIRDSPKAHGDESGNSDRSSGGESPEPEAEKVEQNNSKNQGNHPGRDEKD